MIWLFVFVFAALVISNVIAKKKGKLDGADSVDRDRIVPTCHKNAVIPEYSIHSNDMFDSFDRY